MAANLFAKGHWSRIRWQNHPNRLNPEFRYCPKCKKLRPVDNFWTRSGKIGGNCKECIRLYQISWLEDKGPGYQRQIRRAQLKRYGITEEQFASMLESQRGACAICRKTPGYTLHIDHCHETEKFRGLLCRPCNTAIGQLGDSRESLTAVVAYLMGH